MSAKPNVMGEVWYWTRVAICIVSFGMIYPNVFTERMEKEALKSGDPVDR